MSQSLRISSIASKRKRRVTTSDSVRAERMDTVTKMIMRRKLKTMMRVTTTGMSP